MEMLNIKVIDRPTIEECLIGFLNSGFFPASFHFLHQLGASFQQTTCLYSDSKISLVRYTLEKVNLIDSKKWKQPIEPNIYDQMKISRINLQKTETFVE